MHNHAIVAGSYALWPKDHALGGALLGVDTNQFNGMYWGGKDSID